MLAGIFIGMLLRWVLIAAARLFAVGMARVLLPVTDYAIACAETLPSPRWRLIAFYVAKGTNETSHAICGAVRWLEGSRPES
jgi:hypothetical protein